MTRELLFALWAAIHPQAPKMPDAGPIADAIVQAVREDTEPRAWSGDEEGAVMAYYALRESWLLIDAVGDGGKSCGPWQEPCGFARHATVLDQARYWVRLVRIGGLGGVDSSPARARARVVRALSLLDKARASLAAQGVTERQP